MQGVMLEPATVQMTWQMAKPLTGEQWRSLLKQLFEALALQCQASASAVIGHIKGLAVFPDDAFLRVSVVAPQVPVDIQGNAEASADTMTLTLNLIVYGQTCSDLKHMARQVAQDHGRMWQADVAVVAMDTHLHAHHLHDDRQH